MTDREDDWPRARVAWYGVVMLALAYGVAILDRSVLSLLVQPIERDLGISDTEIGLLGGLAFGLFYASLGVPIGWLADRANRRNIIVAGIVVWSLATGLCGLARDFTELFLARMLVGVGEAALAPAASSMIGDLFPPRIRPKAFGVYVMGTTIGTGFATILGGITIGLASAKDVIGLPVLGDMRPWQIVFLVIGLPGLCVAGLMASVIEPARRGMTRTKASTIAGTLAFMGQHRGAYLAIFIGAAGIIVGVYASIAWTATFFIRAYSWTAQDYAVISGPLGVCAGFISSISSGYATLWFARRDPHSAPLVTIGCGVAGLAVFHIIMPFAPNAYLALCFNFMGNLFSNWPLAAAFTAINQVTPNEMRAQVTALFNLTIGLVALTSGPLVVGLLTDHLFHDKALVGFSLALLYAACGTAGALAVRGGRSGFRRLSQISLPAA